MNRAVGSGAGGDRAELARMKAEVEEARRLQRVMFDLTREVGRTSGEEEVIQLFAEALRGLLPNSYFCIRALDSNTLELTSLYAEGALKPEARDHIGIKRTSVDRFKLQQQLSSSTRVRILERYEPIFEEAGAGTAVPLVNNGRLLGMLNLEYPPGEENLNRDRPILRQIANQLAVSLHNSRSVQETLYLKNYLEQLVESANALILVTDCYRKVRVCNRTTQKLIGQDRDALINRDLLDLFPEQERSRMMRVFIAVLHGRPSSNVETRLRHREGGEVRVSFNTAPLVNTIGEVEGLIAVGQDLSPIRDLEQQMLHVARLASLGETTASSIHEMNNPLTSITVYSTYLLKKLKKGPADDGDLERLLKIREASERILGVTRNVMSFARAHEDQPEPIDVNALVEKTIELCEPAAQRAKARVLRQLGENLPPALGIPGELTQAFVNLVTNACHAVAGQPDPLLVLTTLRANEDRIEILISDNGFGIPEDDLVHVFEPFFTSKPDGEGTGLGLSIVRTIISRHKGTISLESAVGKGTTFTVQLPVLKRESE